MFKEKNLSPRQLALFTAIVLSVPIGIGFFAYGGHSWKEAVTSFVLILGGSYALISYIFQRFIYRKLKLIYKFIYQTKASKKQETYYKYILPQKSIDEVREDVEAWGEQKRREIELLKRNETFRKEFLQNLSHEFKTPVFAIQGYIETLLGGAMEERELSERFLQKAQKNVERLSHLIQDLDEISRLERGELKLHRRNFVIQDLVREVYESLSLLAEPPQIGLYIKKGCEAPLTVWADEEKIRQVLTNLVENAIKYGRQQGSITASIYNTDGRNILVEISDDGMGIPQDALARVFERFYRTPGGRGRDVTGSGLGLSICKHIIEAHGHTIHVRSTENVGTTIGFTLDGRKS
ncbi:ATP-binding protein [Flaviaesturariibacter aridisoli]|uniref:histidine kinase n=1 Tax=Flaviaesturariibacter aridisoli TaxID=2545761 RepID=A0A4R4EA58_9BACT|nr:ATP-binding protein [Flaviaesturariibacter aridisoli]TCZ74748.1 sensor histidine kinase [Flaviaesturariibacter aridisoli]